MAIIAHPTEVRKSPPSGSFWIPKPPFESDHPLEVVGGLWALQYEARLGRPRWWPE